MSKILSDLRYVSISRDKIVKLKDTTIHIYRNTDNHDLDFFSKAVYVWKEAGFFRQMRTLLYDSGKRRFYSHYNQGHL
jgi:hypothetical protein